MCSYHHISCMWGIRNTCSGNHKPRAEKQTVHVECVKHTEHDVTAGGARANALGAALGSGINGRVHKLQPWLQ